MTQRRNRRILLLALLVLFTLTTTMSVNGQTKTRGSAPISRAMQVAYDDFAKQLAADNTTWEYSRYVGDIKNYSIGVREGKHRFVVVFVLNRLPVKINGAGAKYTIDKGSLKIRERTLYK